MAHMCFWACLSFSLFSELYCQSTAGHSSSVRRSTRWRACSGQRRACLASTRQHQENPAGQRGARVQGARWKVCHCKIRHNHSRFATHKKRPDYTKTTSISPRRGCIRRLIGRGTSPRTFSDVDHVRPYCRRAAGGALPGEPRRVAVRASPRLCGLSIRLDARLCRGRHRRRPRTRRRCLGLRRAPGASAVPVGGLRRRRPRGL